MTAEKTTNKKQIFEVLGRQYPLPLMEQGNETKERILMTATLLFAQKGYAAVSIRDIAKVNGVKPPSLYNHFSSKEALWAAVLEHIKKLYFIYLDQVSISLNRAETLEETLAILLYEPKRMVNVFTCYGFTLVMLEQMRDDLAAETFHAFMERGMALVKNKLKEHEARGRPLPFDAGMAAAFFMNNSFMGVMAKAQQLKGRRTTYEPEEMFAELERFLLKAAQAGEHGSPRSSTATEPVSA